MLKDELALPGWDALSLDVDLENMTIFKVSGALTNSVFFVSCPRATGIAPPTVLVRVYGPSSDSLLSVRTDVRRSGLRLEAK
jgi:choline kinase